ncbi:MAG: protein translocase subunit SecF [Oscillospiraceae bacterium]|jgi:preprotein translocase subunit SecF|nr:protein translocase subunit SecF [Oscillospiraceae bacterium]
MKKTYDFIGQKKRVLIISSVVFAVGLIFLLINGVQLDIKFTGGAMLKYAYGVKAELSGSDLSSSDLSATDTAVQSAEDTQTAADADADPQTAVVSSSALSAGDMESEPDLPEISSLGITPTDSTELDTADVASIVKSVLGSDSKVDLSTSLSTTADSRDKTVTISLSEKKALHRQAGSRVLEALETRYPNLSFSSGTVNSVDSVMGQEFFLKCLVAIILASLFMILYVAIRFRKIGGWTAGVVAVAAIIHDCIVVFIAFVVFGFPLDDNFVAVVLSIIGYTINSTIVIFDRVRENRRVLGPKVTLSELCNRSINETLARTINTNLTFIITVAAVAVAAIVYGISSLISFTIPMLFGVISGCYSSIFIANILWVMVEEKRAKNKLAKRAIEKSGKK